MCKLFKSSAECEVQIAYIYTYIYIFIYRTSCVKSKIISSNTKFSITNNPEKEFSLENLHVFAQSSQTWLLCPAERYVQKMQYQQYKMKLKNCALPLNYIRLLHRQQNTATYLCAMTITCVIPVVMIVICVAGCSAWNVAKQLKQCTVCKAISGELRGGVILLLVLNYVKTSLTHQSLN